MNKKEMQTFISDILNSYGCIFLYHLECAISIKGLMFNCNMIYSKQTIPPFVGLVQPCWVNRMLADSLLRWFIEGIRNAP